MGRQHGCGIQFRPSRLRTALAYSARFDPVNPQAAGIRIGRGSEVQFPLDLGDETLSLLMHGFRSALWRPDPLRAIPSGYFSWVRALNRWKSASPPIGLI